MKEWLKFAGARRAPGGASAIVVILAALALLSAQPAQAASFDCAKAATAVEKMICADAALSVLDEALSRAYADALARGTDPEAFKSAQRAWLRNTRDTCADSACLTAAYEARIGEMTDTVGAAVGEAQPATETLPLGSRQAGTYRVVEDNDGTICDPLLQSLNSAWSTKRYVGANIFMSNDFIIQPWEWREYSWTSRDYEKVVRSWEAAFIDINNDGKEDAVFRNSTSIRGRDFHDISVILSIDADIKSTDPMPEERARQIREGARSGPEIGIGKFSPYLAYIELVSLRGRNYLMAGYWIDWWTEGRPRGVWVQLLEVIGNDVKRVCFFKEK